MQNKYSQIMKSKSEEDLMIYINNYKIYQIDAFEAAISELNNRGVKLPVDEIESIRIKMKYMDKDRHSESENIAYDWKKNITADESAPLLYSEKSVNIFSIIFSPIFGSILLAFNLNSLNKKFLSIITIIFGILYSAIMIIIFDYIQYNTLILLILNSFGAIILLYVFWWQFIGKDFEYRNKSIMYPLIISIFITMLFLTDIFISI